MSIEILNIDCMEYMASLPGKAFDLAIVDPPYGIGEHGGKLRFGQKSIAKGFSGAKQYAKKSWDNDTPPDAYFIELRRVSKNQRRVNMPALYRPCSTGLQSRFWRIGDG